MVRPRCRRQHDPTVTFTSRCDVSKIAAAVGLSQGNDRTWFEPDGLGDMQGDAELSPLADVIRSPFRRWVSRHAPQLTRDRKSDWRVRARRPFTPVQGGRRPSLLRYLPWRSRSATPQIAHSMPSDVTSVVLQAIFLKAQAHRRTKTQGTTPSRRGVSRLWTPSGLPRYPTSPAALPIRNAPRREHHYQARDGTAAADC